LDEEHKGLFQGIFKCAAERDNADALKALYEAVVAHFATEEGMMKGKYSDFDAHKALHDKFVADLKGLSTPLNDDQLKFAKNWLVNHIKATDFKYKGQL
jgi:hemerythrin family non-heme iron protein